MFTVRANEGQTPQTDAESLSVDKRTLGPRFRERLGALIASSGLSRSAFAERIGVDRSALSQLLSGRDARLPRAETLASIARSEGVSLDWLLGLVETDTIATEVAPEVAVEERAGGWDDSRLLEWRREAQGAKIRYVPAYLPDLLRLPEIAAVEHGDGGATKAIRLESRLETDRKTLALSRTPEADMEVSMPRQRLDLLASGGGFSRAYRARSGARSSSASPIFQPNSTRRFGSSCSTGGRPFRSPTPSSAPSARRSMSAGCIS